LNENARYWCWARKAKSEYLDIQKLVRKEFDDDPALNVRVLRMMAADTGGIRMVSEEADCRNALLYLTGGVPQELEQAIGILDRMVEPDPVQYASVLLDIGDRRLLSRDADAALEAFREAWSLLETAEGGYELQSEWFGAPQMLYQGSLEYAAGLLSSAPDSLPGQVEIKFVVDERGRPSDYQVISADTTWVADMAAQIVGRSRFRPRLKNGEFVPAASRFTWDYRYDPSVAAELGLELPGRN
jgi:hypothetical protein